jgi:hypothetical protein
MSQTFADFTIWVENLLAALVSLRVFTLGFNFGGGRPPIAYLPYITKISDRALQLEYVAVLYHGTSYYMKRVGGEWNFCDKASFADSTN